MHLIKGFIVYLCLLTGDANLDHLVNVMSAGTPSVKLLSFFCWIINTLEEILQKNNKKAVTIIITTMATASSL